MTLPTWDALQKYHCSSEYATENEQTVENPFYEDMARRRYNYAPDSDKVSCRLVFLKDVLNNSDNKTLVRKGRFIWCRSLKYEGKGKDGLRHISFTVDKGKKRFVVSEKNVLCIPSKTFINNNRYFRQSETTFRAFASVFAYKNVLNMMFKNYRDGCGDYNRAGFIRWIQKESPYSPGTLVAPRLGYFYPSPAISDDKLSHPTDEEHPYGIIIGTSFDNDDYAGREFYRVKFGETTYERVHPVQLEIVNEV